jgi:hypothetical protein
MFSRAIVRYWSGEQTFDAANGPPLYRPFEGEIVRLAIRLRTRRSSRKNEMAAVPESGDKLMAGPLASAFGTWQHQSDATHLSWSMII